MRNHSISVIFFLITASTAACSQENILPGENTSLCESGEQSIFSCSTSARKIASLCIKESGSRTRLQYKYGTREKIELIYPENQTESTSYFKLSSTPYPGGGENRIRFSIKEYDYYLYDVTRLGKDHEGAFPILESGVTVLKNKHYLATMRCINESASIQALAYELLEEEKFDQNISMGGREN